MYNLQATLAEITVEVVDVIEILPATAVMVVDLTSTPTSIDDQLPPPPEVVYVPWDTFPDPSPAQLGLHVTHL